MFFFLYTIGCQMNEYDTNIYRRVLHRYGFQPTEDPYLADLILVNTCAVRDKSIKKAVSFLGITAKIKKQKPSLIVALTGCASALIMKELKSRTFIDFFWGALNQTSIPDQFLTMLGKKGYSDTGESHSQQSAPFTKEIPIIFGCDSFCTYCIVPYLRGREKSLPMEYLLSELDKAVKAGCKEILLLGQNVNHYGKDLSPSLAFADLLNTMAASYPLIRFDFLTSHPKDFDIRILQVMEKHSNIYKHFHLPAQHGDNDVLASMNRGYTYEQYTETIQIIRSFFPMATLSTDLIVGFPGETEAAFQNTVKLVESVQFDMIFAAQYSKRPGTPAEKYPDQIPELVKRERINLLLQKQKSISKQKNLHWIGRRARVMITEKTSSNCFLGKTEEEKTVLLQSVSVEIGNEANVIITEISNGSLIAEMVGE